MKKLLLCSLMFCIAFAAFGQDKQKRKKRKKAKLEQAKTTVEPTPIVEVPLAKPVDTVDPIPQKVAVMTFEENLYEYGTVKAGEKVEHVFKFTNTGEIPLVIETARSTCGCTVPQYPKEPIMPGESGEIAVKFNTKGKSGRQRKPVNITANTYPKLTTVHIDGTVEKAEVKE